MTLASALAQWRQRCLLLDFPSTPPYAMPVEHQGLAEFTILATNLFRFEGRGGGAERVWAIHFGLSWIERVISWTVWNKSPTCRWATLCWVTGHPRSQVLNWICDL